MSEEALQISLEAELDAFFAQYISADQARGLVYGLTNADGLAHWHGYGVANEEGAAPDADTVFPIASMSKSFIACAALVARDAGHLSLSEPITAHVPELTMCGDDMATEDPPTVEMLFSMCGGLTEDNSWVDPFIGLPTDTMLALLHRGVRFSHYPGATYEYSNLGFALAGLAVSRAVGRPLEEFVREAIFEPLGLSSTYFDSVVPVGVARATGYSLDTHGRWVPFPPQSSDAFAAAGGIMSTVRDLARWITWLGSAFRAPVHDNDAVLRRASRREMQRLHVIEQPSLSVGAAGEVRVRHSGYGLGLRVTDDFHRGTILSHAGGLPGFKLFMTWHPVSGLGAIVLTNSHRGDPVAMCTDALGRALARADAPASEVRLWPETVDLQARVDGLLRTWDERCAAEVFAPNVDFDRPLTERRAEIERLVGEVGPLLEPGPVSLVSAATAADVTWSIPGERGELLCMIHLTPVQPAQVQELVVKAFAHTRPRSARPVELSPRRAILGDAFVTPTTNVRVTRPKMDGSVKVGGARAD